ncbi:MAG: FtsX-like permease family protein [Caldilineaceae bacterium]|nr:FtsX-like permease family protein [Caldilineaceae bacterium]
MSVIYAKLWADLWGNKMRTLQIVLIVALGALGSGLALGARNLTAAAISADWVASAPPAMKISAAPPLSEDELLALKSIDGVVAVEGFAERKIEWRHQPGDPWQAATLSTRVDYAEQTMSYWELVAGVWPHGNDFAIERGYDQTFALAPGTQIETRIDERVRPVTITGVLNSHEVTQGFMADPTFYVDHRRFAEITGDDRFGIVAAQLAVHDAAGRYDPARAAAIDGAVQDRLEKLGVDSQGLKPAPPKTVRVDNPDVHFSNSVLKSVFLILGVIGFVIMALGMLLVYTNVSALITQQVGQIGVMKAIGARTRQIVQIYLMLIFVYGVLAVMVSVPLSMWAANGIKLIFLTLLDANGRGFAVDWRAVGLQVVVIFLSLLLASLIPLAKGARMTVREAVSTYGLGGAAGLFDTLIAKLRRVSYTVLLVIGNTFRNISRLTLTQVVLVGSGILFIAVMGVRDAVNYTFGPVLTGIHDYDITLTLQHDVRSARVAQLVAGRPNVAAVETWNSSNGSARPRSQRDHETSDQRVIVFGVPSDSTMFAPTIRAGRWLQPGDDQAVTLHDELAQKIGVGVGDWITLRLEGGKESEWRVVGTFFDPARDTGVYMDQRAYAAAMNRANKANVLLVRTVDTGAAAVAQTDLDLKQFLEDSNLPVEVGGIFDVTTVNEIAAHRLRGLSIIIRLLSIMVVVVAVVGSVGLSGTLSLSVMERTREIGVMRAIGASSRRIMGMFVGEGLIQGVLSWLVAIPFGVAGAYVMAVVVLSRILGDELLYVFRPTGVLAWLLVVVVLGIAASWLPARRATRVSVRESLAYQ